jgi:hypothetical protein
VCDESVSEQLIFYYDNRYYKCFKLPDLIDRCGLLFSLCGIVHGLQSLSFPLYVVDVFTVCFSVVSFLHDK